MPVSPKVNSNLPFWSAPGAALHLGDVRECLRRLPDRSVHCCVTSPPYWNLRDYRTGTWRGGSAECDHIERTAEMAHTNSTLGPRGVGHPLTNAAYQSQVAQYKHLCRKCGAKRTDHQLGAEDVADCLGWATGVKCGECFVCHMVEVFAEVRRVLRNDGTLWLNLGDTFGGMKNFDHSTGPYGTGNLVGIPWRVALALQANEWILRQDIIWYAPNKMPESVTNRCAKSHEHIFLLAKGDGYYFDHVAIMSEGKTGPSRRLRANGVGTDETEGGVKGGRQAGSDGVVNKRDVWVVSTKGYPGAHFATFSPELITPCILAGTSEVGCCARCGAPCERVVVRVGGIAGDASVHPRCIEIKDDIRDRSFEWSRNGKPGTNSTLDGMIAKRETLGWRRTCDCQSDLVPCTVLDPFVGSGTTVATALRLGRRGVGIDLSEEYLRENAVPRVEAALSDAAGSGDRSASVMAKRAAYAPPQPESAW